MVWFPWLEKVLGEAEENKHRSTGVDHIAQQAPGGLAAIEQCRNLGICEQSGDGKTPQRQKDPLKAETVVIIFSNRKSQISLQKNSGFAGGHSLHESLCMEILTTERTTEKGSLISACGLSQGRVSPEDVMQSAFQWLPSRDSCSGGSSAISHLLFSIKQN